MENSLKVFLVFALLGLLLLGCTAGAKNSANSTNATTQPVTHGNATLTSTDVGALENPDSESTDPGLPLEDI